MKAKYLLIGVGAALTFLFLFNPGLVTNRVFNPVSNSLGTFVNIANQREDIQLLLALFIIAIAFYFGFRGKGKAKE